MQRAVAEVEQLVDLALGLLHQHVLAGDADVGRAGLDVRRHVGGPHRDDPDVAEQQLAVVGAHLARVDPDRVEQVERLLEERAARNGDREAGSRHGAPLPALLAGQRDVQPLDRQREADRRQRPAEAAEQLVVAPAAADRHAERRVVDLEDRARVVAEAAHEPEVEDQPLGDARLQQRVDAAQALGRLGRRTVELGEHLRPAAQLRHAHEQLRRLGAEAERARPRAPGRRSRA